MRSATDPFLIAVIGAQNAGKTTLVERMVAEWSAQGKVLAVIKHDGHARAGVTDWEKPDSDTRRAAAAGAAFTMVAGGGETLLGSVRDAHSQDPRALSERLVRYAQLCGQRLDGIVLEGFKRSDVPKVAVVRRQEDVAWLQSERLAQVVAVVCAAETLRLADGQWQVYHEDDVPRLCRDLWR